MQNLENRTEETKNLQRPSCFNCANMTIINTLGEKEKEVCMAGHMFMRYNSKKCATDYRPQATHNVIGYENYGTNK